MKLEKGIMFIDTSYFIFDKYFAALCWYKKKFKERPFHVLHILEDEAFMFKYRLTFQNTFLALSTFYNIPTSNIVFVKDCPRKNIWRNLIFPSYKACRLDKSNIFNKDIFKYTYDILLPWIHDSYQSKELYVESLEADDVIALSVQKLQASHPDIPKYIISNDNDYIQLCYQNVFLRNLQKKDILERIQHIEYYTLLKILLGDKNDNIQGVFKKTEEELAIECIKNPSLLEKYLQEKNLQQRFILNKILIDFNFIPQALKQQFYHMFTNTIVNE